MSKGCRDKSLPPVLAVLLVFLTMAGCQSTPKPHHVRNSAAPQSTAPSANPTPRADGFPGPADTGVPRGIKLSPYKGPMHIKKCGKVIDRKLISGDLSISASNGTTSPDRPCVTIRRSRIEGVVNISDTRDKLGPLVMTDDEINPPNDSQVQAIVGTNFYLWRVDVHGGANGGIDCAGYCAIRDSWVHDFYNAGVTHYDGIISNGTFGHPMVVEHNTIECGFYAAEPGANGGCSADLGLFGDFSAISHVTVTHNLLVAGSRRVAATGPSFCAYGGTDKQKAYPNADHVVFADNIFERGTATGKCGAYGPITDYAPGLGNVWSGNVWDDGPPVTP